MTCDQHGGVLFYDSGLGGLNVVEALAPLLEHVSVTYVADNSMFPIGRNSEETVRRRCITLLPYVVKQVAPQLLIVACNTASTASLSQLESVLDIPVFGISPNLELLVARSATRVVALLATPSTLQRREIASAITRFQGRAEIIPVGSIELVLLAQEKMFGRSVSQCEIVGALAALLDHPRAPLVDSILLGCTHFDAITPEISQAIGRVQTSIVKSAENLCPELLATLKQIRRAKTRRLKMLLTGADDADRHHRLFQSRGFESHILKIPIDDKERLHEIT